MSKILSSKPEKIISGEKLSSLEVRIKAKNISFQKLFREIEFKRKKNIKKKILRKKYREKVSYFIKSKIQKIKVSSEINEKNYFDVIFLSC